MVSEGSPADPPCHAGVHVMMKNRLRECGCVIVHIVDSNHYGDRGAQLWLARVTNRHPELMLPLRLTI